jgi:hypothetical protein
MAKPACYWTAKLIGLMVRTKCFLHPANAEFCCTNYYFAIKLVYKKVLYVVLIFRPAQGISGWPLYVAPGSTGVLG